MAPHMNAIISTLTMKFYNTIILALLASVSSKYISRQAPSLENDPQRQAIDSCTDSCTTYDQTINDKCTPKLQGEQPENLNFNDPKYEEYQKCGCKALSESSNECKQCVGNALHNDINPIYEEVCGNDWTSVNYNSTDTTPIPTRSSSSSIIPTSADHDDDHDDDSGSSSRIPPSAFAFLTASAIALIL
ncbi:hypothetical protein E3Q22_03234 [Wallemia mellicola]|uniref:Uncharacterized protein n=1 Tax=Wallemia mellicola TaxID=1708541 RepID=A0A4T0LTG8_9BASI|nr:hypothetical protein E3Q23_03133 [Wallemia mellicola]TIB77114.1 hypothetical protein E3Q22_03234 [Wallemia mellicola]TIC10823.1 hypothetical protein E3Q14_02591 [Wallemia mellicola]TIC15961.1 hypothetical protein E3Q13_03179 [Wallemia mellicola]